MTRSSSFRAERRRVGRVSSPALAWLALGDARFFARSPARRHRVRLLGPAEVDAVTDFDAPALLRAKPDYRLAAVVRLVAPGSMVRAVFPAWKGQNLDFSEPDAALLFDVLTALQPGSLGPILRALAEQAAKAEGIA